MVEMASTQTSGMTCTKCDKDLPVAEWVEYTDEGKLHQLWWCNNCGNKFMTMVDCPADAGSKGRDVHWEEMFPPLLVA